MAPSDGANDDFRVSGFDHYASGLIARFPRFWIGLGNLETRALADAIEDVPIEAPVYVAGLARAGTTIALEILAAHPDVATHLYRDFPPVFTPWWWNWFVEHSRSGAPVPRERSHRDGIMVTADSPEAREEVIWMAFFDHLHDPSRSNVLDRETGNPQFEAFYRDHIRKLLTARKRRRYLSKGNYNITRLSYLHSMFTDARFVVPLRDPVWHVASLIKQHRLFCAGERDNPRALEYMRRVGHFEFGLDLRPINCGDDARLREIEALWQSGDEVRGWARYWATVYGHVADMLDRDAELNAATMVLRYEDLCDRPEATLRSLLAHCRLSCDETALAQQARRLKRPGYYRPDFADAERAAIAEETAAVRERLQVSQPA